MDKELANISDNILEDLLSKLPLPDSAKDSMRNFLNLRRELSKESDRGMTLYATSYLDKKLESLLQNKLIGNKKHFKDLFSFNGPLGTFSSKIKLAFSIGLIDKDSMDDINVLRKIRNEFAHSDQNIDLDSEHIKKLINKLKLNVTPEGASMKHIFINVVAGISGRIEGSLNTAKKFNELISPDLDKRKAEFNTVMEAVLKEIN